MASFSDYFAVWTIKFYELKKNCAYATKVKFWVLGLFRILLCNYWWIVFFIIFKIVKKEIILVFFLRNYKHLFVPTYLCTFSASCRVYVYVGSCCCVIGYSRITRIGEKKIRNYPSVSSCEHNSCYHRPYVLTLKLKSSYLIFIPENVSLTIIWNFIKAE